MRVLALAELAERQPDLLAALAKRPNVTPSSPAKLSVVAEPPATAVRPTGIEVEQWHAGEQVVFPDGTVRTAPAWFTDDE